MFNILLFNAKRQSYIFKSDLNVQLLFGVSVHKLQGVNLNSSNSDSNFVDKPVAVCQTAHLPVRARQEVLFARTSLFRAKSSKGMDIAANAQTGSFTIAVISLRGIPARWEEMRGWMFALPPEDVDGN